MEENKIIKLFTGETIKENDREFTKVIGGFGDDKPIFLVWQASELLGMKTGKVIENFNNNSSKFEEN
jgi:hypothetical protein